MKKRKQKLPEGGEEARVQRVVNHYEKQTEAEVISEDETAYKATTHTAMRVPVELVPAVRGLIARRDRKGGSRRKAHNPPVQPTGSARG